ncbi:ATP-binding protein [Streptomyces sp. NPDC056411]|uniref:ATP-binding protein n=1 Tax=Streptomyces sp. NPDC056411 TaxID=3345813 RepID=UPI0035D6DFCE
MSTRARPAATRLTAARPPAAAHRFPSDGRSAGRARAALRRQLLTWRIGGEAAHSAALLLSELVTNAVTAQAPPAPDIGVRFALSDGRLRLEVRDTSDALPEMKQAEEDEECGRGLVLVNALASGWGIDRDGTGKIVWAELAVSSTAPEAHETPPRRLP